MFLELAEYHCSAAFFRYTLGYKRTNKLMNLASLRFSIRIPKPYDVFPIIRSLVATKQSDYLLGYKTESLITVYTLITKATKTIFVMK